MTCDSVLIHCLQVSKFMPQHKDYIVLYVDTYSGVTDHAPCVYEKTVTFL